MQARLEDEVAERVLQQQFDAGISREFWEGQLCGKGDKGDKGDIGEDGNADNHEDAGNATICEANQICDDDSEEVDEERHGKQLDEEVRSVLGHPNSMQSLAQRWYERMVVRAEHQALQDASQQELEKFKQQMDTPHILQRMTDAVRRRREVGKVELEKGGTSGEGGSHPHTQLEL